MSVVPSAVDVKKDVCRSFKVTAVGQGLSKVRPRDEQDQGLLLRFDLRHESRKAASHDM